MIHTNVCMYIYICRQGVEVGESVSNQYRGMSSLFTWVPKRCV